VCDSSVFLLAPLSPSSAPRLFTASWTNNLKKKYVNDTGNNGKRASTLAYTKSRAVYNACAARWGNDKTVKIDPRRLKGSSGFNLGNSGKAKKHGRGAAQSPPLVLKGLGKPAKAKKMSARNADDFPLLVAAFKRKELTKARDSVDPRSTAQPTISDMPDPTMKDLEKAARDQITKDWARNEHHVIHAPLPKEVCAALGIDLPEEGSTWMAKHGKASQFLAIGVTQHTTRSAGSEDLSGDDDNDSDVQGNEQVVLTLNSESDSESDSKSDSESDGDEEDESEEDASASGNDDEGSESDTGWKVAADSASLRKAARGSRKSLGEKAKRHAKNLKTEAKEEGARTSVLLERLVAAVEKSSDAPTARAAPAPSEFEGRLGKMETDMAELKGGLSQLMGMVRTLAEREISPAVAPVAPTTLSPAGGRGDANDWECGEERSKKGAEERNKRRKVK